MVLATDGTSLFWPSGAGVNRLDPPSTTPQALFSASPAGIVKALAVDDSYVYVPSSDLTGTGGTIGRVSKSGGSLATIVGGQAQPSAIAVDDSSIYWVNSGYGAIYDGSYVPDALMSANKDGSGVTVLAGDTPTSLTRGIVAVAVERGVRLLDRDRERSGEEDAERGRRRIGDCQRPHDPQLPRGPRRQRLLGERHGGDHLRGGAEPRRADGVQVSAPALARSSRNYGAMLGVFRRSGMGAAALGSPTASQRRRSAVTLAVSR